MSLQFALIFLAGLVIGGSATALYHTVRRQEERIRALEEAARKHLPNLAAENVENATAAILALKFDLNIKNEMVDNALSYLYTLRNPQKPRKERS